MRLNSIRIRCKSPYLHPPISCCHIRKVQICTNMRIRINTHDPLPLKPNLINIIKKLEKLKMREEAGVRDRKSARATPTTIQPHLRWKQRQPLPTASHQPPPTEARFRSGMEWVLQNFGALCHFISKSKQNSKYKKSERGWFQSFSFY